MSPLDLALLAGLDIKINIQGPFSDPAVALPSELSFWCCCCS